MIFFQEPHAEAQRRKVFKEDLIKLSFSSASPRLCVMNFGRKVLFACVLMLSAINGLSAQVTFSGVLDSSVSFRAGAGDAPEFSYGVEEYANLRMQAKLRDRAAIYGAANFIAMAGDYAANAAPIADVEELLPEGAPVLGSFLAGENYFAAIELERLYFRLNGETADFDGGLMRLPFGYGQVWGPSDFLNPKNPLKPDARPRAILGAALSAYPVDSLKLLAFGAAPRNPFLREGKGALAGISVDRHWDKASIQALYSFETPNDGSEYGIHRAGLSVKADLELGFVMDALYTYNPEAGTGLDGLSFSIGADYSLFDGNLIILAEYLYNGENSSTSDRGGGSFSNTNYLYTSFTWRFNDFTNISAALISSFDDVSFTPLITLNHDLFQGVSLAITAQVPLDRDLFYGDGNRGELGPLPPDKPQPLLPITGERVGQYAAVTAGLKMRF